MLGFALSFSATNLIVRGRFEQLLRTTEEILQIGGATHTAWNRGPVLLFQAFVWLDHGEPAKAIASLNESVRLANQVIRTEFRLEAQALLCWYYTTLGAFEIAAEEYHGSRRPHQEVKIPQFQVLIWSLNALYEIASGQLETAEATLRDCTFDLKLPGTTWAHLAKSQLAFAKGDFLQAIALADQTADYMRQAGLDQFLPDLLLVQSRAHLALNEHDYAKQSLVNALAARAALNGRSSPCWRTSKRTPSILPDYGSGRARSSSTLRTMQALVSCAAHFSACPKRARL
jgi:tetratricopeptide (TPR) repeat protein